MCEGLKFRATFHFLCEGLELRATFHFLTRLPLFIFNRGYFNYDPASKFGPGKWDDLKDSSVSESDEARYWKDFSKFISPGLGSNKCDNGSKKQSPIDVNMDDVRAECLQYHEFRHKPGDYRLGEDSAIKVKIMPSKLRLEYPSDVGNYDADKRSFGGHPAADVPKGW